MTDIRKLRRGALEPARVFGRRDFDPKAAGAVLHYSFDGKDYYSPAYPTWMIRDGECGVLDKAITRYGMREAPVTGRWVEYAGRLFADAGTPIDLGEPLDYSLSNGVVFAAHTVGPLGVVPATPVMYLLRRFDADSLDFQFDPTMKVVRAWVDGECVAVIRIVATERVSRWTPEVAA